MKDTIHITIDESCCNGMAVPKSRRSKAKRKTRLATWKKKVEKAAKLALNSAKTFLKKEKNEVNEVGDQKDQVE